LANPKLQPLVCLTGQRKKLTSELEIEESDNATMAQSNEPEIAYSGTGQANGASADRPAREKKRRFASPEINKLLQMKWGLALLGEERSKEYLAWLYEKLNRKAQQ
jgi:hypothetical protein